MVSTHNPVQGSSTILFPRPAPVQGSSVISPTIIPNLLMWQRADLGITLNGADVSQWDDQTANGNDFLQASATNQPLFTATNADLNNQSSVDFDGVNEFMSTAVDPAGFAGIAGMTMMMAVHQNDITGTQALIAKWLHLSQDTFVLELIGAEVAGFIADNITDPGLNKGTTSGTTLTTNTSYILTMVFDGAGAGNPARLKIYVDGGTEKTLDFVGTIPAALTSGTASVDIGRVDSVLLSYTNSDIAETANYSSALNANDLNLLGNYMANRYGTTWTDI